MTQSTRGRLMAAALELFAKQGFSRTTVGEIEAGAGLTARGGALYKHFRSKQELLEEAVAWRVEELVRRREDLLRLVPIDDLRSEITLVSRWLLSELDRTREINTILEKEADAFPQLVERFHRELVEPGYRGVAQFVANRVVPAMHADLDAEAVALFGVGALINYRRTEWTFGQLPLDVDEERFVKAVVDGLLALARDSAR